jgi:hypothetical protein
MHNEGIVAIFFRMPIYERGVPLRTWHRVPIITYNNRSNSMMCILDFVMTMGAAAHCVSRLPSVMMPPSITM